MRQSRITLISANAPVAETNPAVAAAGASGSASDSAHVHPIAAPATPTTQAQGDAASNGVGVGFAPDTHKHGMFSTWAKVAAGQGTAASSLDLASLSGFRRYHLELTMLKVTPGTTNWQTTMKLNNSGAHNAQKVKITNATVTGVGAVAQATQLLNDVGANTHTQELIVADVVHDDQLTTRTNYQVTASRTAGISATDIMTIAGGCETTSVASITEILMGLGVSQDDYSYVLYGSNEIA